MQENYEETMLPLFLRLGGNHDQLHMVGMVDTARADVTSSPVSVDETSNVLAVAHCALTRALEE